MVQRHSNRSSFTIDGAKAHYSPDLELEPVHMEVRLSFDIEQKQVWGSNSIKIKANVDNAKYLQLDAIDFDELTIDSDTCGWEYDSEIIHITLRAPLAKGETIIIPIVYKVIEPVAGLYFSFPDEQYKDRPVYVASDHETERARYWLPSIDNPTVRTTFDWYLTAKEEYTILAIGEELESHSENGMKTLHWKHDFPCPTYIAAITIGKFVEYKDRNAKNEDDDIPVAYYTSDNYSSEQLKLSFAKTPQMIEWLVSKLNRPMAWKKYFQFALPGFWGAMENQSLVSWSDFAILNEDTAPEKLYLVDLINIHEMAHTYFGDMVVVKNFAHAWLKESWATYIESVWLQDHLGEDDFRYNLFGKARDYAGEVKDRYIRPIVTRTFNHTWQMFDSHLYPGGCWRIHMLRMELGDAIFWEAVHDYIASHEGEVVETIDFQRKLEKHSAKNLNQFFDQWIFEAKGYPQLLFTFKYDKQDGIAKFSIEQTQVQENKDDVKFNPFELVIDIAWYDNQKKTYTCHPIKLTKKTHNAWLTIPDPHHVRLDPHGKILHQLKAKIPRKYLVNQLKAPDVVGRILAVQALLEKPKKSNFASIRAAYDDEQFWGVKNEIIQALSNNGSLYAIPNFVKLIQSETDPLVLPILYQQAGQMMDTEIRDALLDRLTQPLGPYAKSSLLSALGFVRDGKTKKILLDHIEKRSYQELTKTGAFQGLSKLRDSSISQQLLTRLAYGNEPYRVRPSLVSSIATLGHWGTELEKLNITDEFLRLTQDPNEDVRLASARGLSKMKAKDALNRLEQMKGLHAKQDHIPIEKAIRSIRKSSLPHKEAKNLTENIENLTKQLKTLENRIDELDASNENKKRQETLSKG